MTTQRMEIELRGIPLECEYEWDEGEPKTWDHPGAPAGAFLIRCFVGGRNIIDLLDDRAIREIEEILAQRTEE